AYFPAFALRPTTNSRISFRMVARFFASPSGTGSALAFSMLSIACWQMFAKLLSAFLAVSRRTGRRGRAAAPRFHAACTAPPNADLPPTAAQDPLDPVSRLRGHAGLQRFPKHCGNRRPKVGQFLGRALAGLEIVAAEVRDPLSGRLRIGQNCGQGLGNVDGKS